MAERTFVSFDWAIKKILRHKENFEVLEGFLSELLGFDVFIQNILEDVLNPTNYQKTKYGIQSVADIFPKYYILRVGSFKSETVVDPIDEWFYFLKKSEIKDSFKAKGMERAKSVLLYETMPEDEKRAYSRRIENRRIENSVIDTAIGKTAWLKSIEIAKKLLLAGSELQFVADMTELSLEEVTLLSEGKELDTNTDDEE